MLKLINIFTLNLAKPYVRLTGKIIFNPSEIALKIKRGQAIDVSPFSYVRQGVVCIIGIWLLGYLITNRMSSAPSIVFSIIIGIYFIIKIMCFAIILWISNAGRKPISLSLKAYSYVVGALAPITTTIIEVNKTYYIYSRRIYDSNSIENIIITIFGIIGIGYLYKFMRIIQQIKIVRFITAIIIYAIIANAIIDPLFIALIDLAKMKALL